MEGELQQLLHMITAIVSGGVVIRVILIFQNGRSEEKSVKEICRKAGRVVYAGMIAVTILSFSGWTSEKFSVLQGAGNVRDMETVIVEAIRIVKDTLIILTGTLTIWHFLRELLLYQFGDEDDKAAHAKGAIKQFITGVLILCAGGIVSAVLSYFS